MIWYSPKTTNVMPLNQDPKYVNAQRSAPNLIESTKSSTKNKRLNSAKNAFTWATLTCATCCTFSCGNANSHSKYSL